MTGIYDCPYWVFVERYSHDIFGVLSKTRSEFPYMVEWNYLEPYRVLTMTWNWGISPRSSLNNFYSPSFSFMHNVPTVFRIIMNPASLVSSMSFYRLTFELQLMRHDSLLFFSQMLGLLVMPRYNDKVEITPGAYYEFLVYRSILIKDIAGVGSLWIPN